MEKRNRLIEELSCQPEPQIVAAERFFDGNDDTGSIGCNLLEHPGIAAFRDILLGLRGRPDVDEVYAVISELDPGEDSWPFTDLIVVVGRIAIEELRELLAALIPDEIGLAKDFGVPTSTLWEQDCNALAAWWD